MKRDIDKLRVWCIRKRLSGMKVSEICGLARVPRMTFYFWWQKYKRSGFEGLYPISRRPKTVHRTSEHIVEKIVNLREETGCNEKAISARLKEEGISVGHNTIYRVLNSRGMIDSLGKPRRKRTYISWSRKHPNSLWQTDLSIYQRKYLATFIDDCSRFVVGIDIFEQGTAENILPLFEKAIDAYGKPKEVITDHGSQYYSVRGGVSEFDVFCKTNGIKHILGGIGRPTTLGKIERFHRTFKDIYHRFETLSDFVEYYNFEKPHAGIGYVPPAHIYLK